MTDKTINCNKELFLPFPCLHFLLLTFISIHHPAPYEGLVFWWVMSSTAHFLYVYTITDNIPVWSSDYLSRVDHLWPMGSLDKTLKKTYFKGNLHLELTPSWHFDIFSLEAECQYWCTIRVLALLVLQLNVSPHTAAGWLVHLQLQGHIVSSRTYQMLASHRAVSFFFFSPYFVSLTNDLHV